VPSILHERKSYALFRLGTTPQGTLERVADLRSTIEICGSLLYKAKIGLLKCSSPFIDSPLDKTNSSPRPADLPDALSLISELSDGHPSRQLKCRVTAAHAQALTQEGKLVSAVSCCLFALQFRRTNPAADSDSLQQYATQLLYAILPALGPIMGQEALTTIIFPLLQSV
jgi:hypothetical protein